MPKVPIYTPQVDTTPAPRPARSGYQTVQLQTPPGIVSPSPAAKGAGFGRDLAAIGTAIAGAETQRQDQVRITQAERKLSDWEIDRIYHPEHGALNVQGEAVFGLEDKLNEDYDQHAGEISASLNERQRERFDRISEGKRQDWTRRLQVHVAGQSRALDANETKASIANESSITIANSNDLDRVALGIDNVRRQAGLFAKRNGMGPEQTKELINGFVSDIHQGVIGRYLDQGQDIQAKVYYEHAQAEIDGTKQGQIERALEVGSTAGDASRAASDIWDKLGPKYDTDTVSLDTLANAARDEFKDDPKRVSATIQELKERKFEFDSGKQERSEAATSDVWKMALEGKPLSEIKTTSQYRALTGKQQTEVNEHVTDRLYALDQRAKSAADYLRAQGERRVDEAYQAESRAHSRKVWAKQDEEEKAYAAYEDALSDPQSFSKMSENQILGLLPTLGKTLTNDLLSKRKELNSPDKIVQATLEADLFNQVAEDAGLAPFKDRKTEADKSRLGALRNYTLDRIRNEQATTGKMVGIERKREIMESAATDIVTAPGLLFDTHKRAFEIKLSDIPPTDRLEIERRLRATGLPFTDQDILDAFAEKRQRGK